LSHPKRKTGLSSDTNILKAIEVVQGIINRIGRNSFLIKGWTITLVVITMLLKGTDIQILIAFVPLFVFWYLDAYFLWQERMYRELYKWIITTKPIELETLFDMNAYRFESDVDSQLRIMRSKTLICFYGSVVILILLYAIILPLVILLIQEMVPNAV